MAADPELLSEVAAELQRLKLEGVKGVYLDDATWQWLDRATATAPTKPNASAESESAEVALANAQPSAQPTGKQPESGSLLLDYLEQETAGSTAKAPPQKRARKTAAKTSSSAKGLPEGVAPIPEPTPFELPEGDKPTRWNWLRERVLSDPVCNEHKKPHCQVVFGVGNLDAEIFFCGEAPGQDEEEQGEPFVGPAGQLLNKILSAMKLAREDVYIGNILNWRPETGKAFGNRPPTSVEMAYCLPYLRAQLAIVQPKLIVALGNTAVTGLLGEDPARTMGRIRGQVLDFEGTALVPTYHPSYLLRNQAHSEKRKVWEDMLVVMKHVGLPISEKQRNFFR